MLGRILMTGQTYGYYYYLEFSLLGMEEMLEDFILL